MFRFLLLFTIIIIGTQAYSQAFKLDPIRMDSNIYESPIKVIQSIQVVGNQVTKGQIIKRELLFDIGDTIKTSDFANVLEQSKKNILNTSLFNFAKIEWALLDPSHVFIIVTVTERWYTFPVPIFEIDDNNFNTWWQSKDFSRINYGFNLVRNNFRGRKEKLDILAQFGFTERIRVKYTIPYVNKNQRGGLGLEFSYNRKDEISFTSKSNERQQYKSFGTDAIKNFSYGINYTFRNEIFNTHAIGIEYDQYRILDTVRVLNPNFLGYNRTRTNFFSLYYTFVNDKRDSKNYPLSGRLFYFNIKKSGLGISKNGLDLTNIGTRIKKYWDLGKRMYLAGSLRGEYALNNNQPYLLQNGLGYSSSYGIRAYELYVIDGQNIGLAKAQIKYQLVKPREVDLQFIRYEKISKFHYAFYLGVFSDFAYVEDNTGFYNNRLANDFLYSSGIGLDFVSYYDVVIRTEFSINKFGETGIFFHFVAPI